MKIHKPRVSKPTKKRNRYSDSEKAHALLALEANDGNVMLTAKELGIPRDTLNRWNYGHVHSEVLMLQQQQKLPLADRLESIVDLLLDGVPSKRQAANLQQTMTSIAIGIDKMRLLRGESTAITEKVQGNDEQLFERLQRLRSRLQLLRVDSPAITAPVSPAESPALELPAPGRNGHGAGNSHPATD